MTTLRLLSQVSKFADDTKLRSDVPDLEFVRALQRELAAIGEWSTVWQMHFNLDKCHALHVGFTNKAENDFLLGSETSIINEERDLGVVITADLKSSAQCFAV